MRIGRVIRRRIRHDHKGVNVSADVNATIAAAIGERAGTSVHVSSRQRVVQGNPDPSEDEAHAHRRPPEGGNHERS